MNMFYIYIFFLLYIVILLWIKVATVIDVKWYKDERTKKKVSVDIPENATDGELSKLFRNQNMYEMTLFLGGLTVGGLLIYLAML